MILDTRKVNNGKYVNDENETVNASLVTRHTFDRTASDNSFLVGLSPVLHSLDTGVMICDPFSEVTSPDEVEGTLGAMAQIRGTCGTNMHFHHIVRGPKRRSKIIAMEERRSVLELDPKSRDRDHDRLTTLHSLFFY